MKNDIIKLIKLNEGQDADGFPIDERVERQIFADIQSVKRSEFYAAASAKVNASLVAVVNYADYDAFKKENGKPTHVLYDHETFKIVRTYRKGKMGDFELTLSEVE